MTPRHALLAMLAMCPPAESLAAQGASREAALAAYRLADRLDVGLRVE